MQLNTYSNSIRSRSGYTVVELLVVTVIAVLLLTISVPAFQATIYSSNRTLAANAIQASTVMARDVAINTGKDGAVVFVYDPEVGQINIIPAIRVGTLREVSMAPAGGGGGGGPQAAGFGDQPYFDRDVFVPAPIGEVLNLPENWMVRGYAPTGLLLDVDSAGDSEARWYNSDLYGGDDVNDSLKEMAHWLFPETGFFARDAQINGGDLDGGFNGNSAGLPTARQSFMIRFDARTGAVSRDTRSALFVDPRNSRQREPGGDRPDKSELTLRVDFAEDLEVWAQRILNSPDLNDDGFAFRENDGDLREEFIGTVSNDTILVKPISRLALYDVNKLSLGLGARGVNRDTNTFYLPHDQSQSASQIQLDMTLFPNGMDEGDVIEQITKWIDGDTNLDDVIDLDDEPESRLFLVESYTGELKEILR
jgi:type II secretory pathway pseudopilin PulG